MSQGSGDGRRLGLRDTITCPLFAAALLAAPAAAQTCDFAGAEKAWTDRALAAWRLVETDGLKLPAAPEPTMVFFDAACRFERAPDGRWSAAPHAGQIRLPDGESLEPRVASFASPSEGGGFFVMALPSIWRAAGVASDLGLEDMMSAVLVHEVAHTRQFAALNPRLEALTKKWSLPETLNDDIVQTTFQADPTFKSAFEAERDLLFRAAAAPTDPEAKALAAEALARIQARRARYWVGQNAKYAELEDVWLTMEGIGQWAGYAWLVHPRGGAKAADLALAGMRRGDRQWSQAQGLALFLVVDRLVPGWQAKAFADQPATALELLAMAAR